MKKAFIFALSGLAALLVAFSLLTLPNDSPESLTSVKARDYAVFLDTLSTTESEQFCYSYYTYDVSITNFSSMPVQKTSCGAWNE